MYRRWKFHFPVSSIILNAFFFPTYGSVILLVVSQPTYYWAVGWLQNYKRHGNKQSWSKWDILLAFGCMVRGKLQKASVMIARMCGIMVKIQNRYFWIQVTSITVQDVTLWCTVTSAQCEPGPWRWRQLDSSQQSEPLASWHSITTQKICICRSITTWAKRLHINTHRDTLEQTRDYSLGNAVIFHMSVALLLTCECTNDFQVSEPE